MVVRVNWDTDGYSVEELSLPELVNIPTMSGEQIADALSDKYGYCVESFVIEDLDSGYWEGEIAWVLSDEDGEMEILVGGHTLEEALEAKEQFDNYFDTDYDNYIVSTDSNIWIEQQDLSGEWMERYEW